MISALGLKIAAVFRRTAPDPFVIVILLTFLTAALAMMFGFPAVDGGRPTPLARFETLGDAWSRGLWDLLKFAMQMCLILVTGHALADSRPMRRVLESLAGLPRTGAGAAALVAGAACLAGIVNWGLGLIVGAVLAREVGRSAEVRGVRVHYPLLAAAGYMGLLVFHGGLSGSAPLAMSTFENAKAVLPPATLELLGGQGIGLDRTLGSTLNLVVTGGMVVGLPLLFVVLAPRASECHAMSRYVRVAPTTEEAEPEPGGTVPEWLERTPVLSLALAMLLITAFVYFVARSGPARIGFDQVNMAMFALGLACHGSVRSYAASLERAAGGCAGIIIQFPLYGGIMAMMSASGLTRLLSEGITGVADAGSLPVLTFLAATLVGLFVPSGGAQWSIQGPIALDSGARLGVDPGSMVMAVGYGDELANMLQPFWALPLLAITGVKARDIVGYTAIVMVVAGVWMGVGLVVL